MVVAELLLILERLQYTNEESALGKLEVGVNEGGAGGGFPLTKKPTESCSLVEDVLLRVYH